MTVAIFSVRNRRNPQQFNALSVLVWLCISLLWLATGDAQEVPKPAAPAAAPAPSAADALTTELDITTLLTSPDIMPSKEFEDSFWHINGQLLQVPLLVNRVTAPAELNQASLKVRGGRFITWRLVDWVDNNTGQAVAPPALIIDNQSIEYPTTMRQMTIKPQGTIFWKIDKTLPGAQLVPLSTVENKADKPYTIWLTPGALQTKHPKPPTPAELRPLPGEKPGDTAVRVRGLQDVFNAKQADFKRLQATVKALPTEFEVPAPKRVWGLFVLNLSAKELGIEGPGFEPWTIKLDDLRALQRCAGVPLAAAQPNPATFAPTNPGYPGGFGGPPGGPGGPGYPPPPGYAGPPAPTAPPPPPARVTVGFGGDRTSSGSSLSSETLEQINRMTALLKDKHPYSYRCVAFALRGGKLVQYAQDTPTDTLNSLIKMLILCPDKVARDSILEDLVKTQPPTPAITTLLKSAAQFMTPELQAVMVRNAMQGIDAFNAAQQMLSDATGPSPNLVVRELAAAAANPQRSDIAAQMVRGFRLSDMTDERRERTIAAVIEIAGESPGCATILNRQLLGAVDNKTVATTLELLANAETQGLSLRPTINTTLTALFGKAPGVVRANVSNRPKAIISQLIPIDSVTHNIFRVLRSGDPRLKSLAWRSLDFFTLYPSVNPNDQDPMEAIIALAVDQNPTPPQVVDLVARQANAERATRGLAKIVFSANGDASTRATRLLVGSSRPLYEVLQSLSFGERQGFASRIYMNLTGRDPLVTALMRERSDANPVVKWFADQLSEGRLPDSAAWGVAAGPEDRLLTLVASADSGLAMGAVAALIASVGGEEFQATSLTDQLRQGQDFSLTKLRSVWLPTKQKIFAQRVQKSSGFYNLRFVLTETRTEFTPKGPMKRFVETAIPIGKVQFQADGQTVKLVNQNIAMAIPENVLAVRIANPAELKNFPNEQLAALALDTLKVPLDLVPQGDATWRGSISISENRKLDMILTPMSE